MLVFLGDSGSLLMTGDGVFGLTAGALQLVVPSYGLRLVRRFGAQRVGWFLVTAFTSLAFMHLFAPLNFGEATGSELLRNGMFVFASVLLVIGMGHMETYFTTREQASVSEESVRSRCEYEAKKEIRELTRANENLLRQLADREEAEKELREAEAQYRFLFTENPQPMWVLDIASRRFLSANQSALRQFGFSADELSGLSLDTLLAPDSLAAFCEEMAEPCASPAPRGIWPCIKTDRTIAEIEITALDFDCAGSRARLMLTRDVTEQRRRESRLHKSEKMELAGQIAGGVATQFNSVLNAIEQNTAGLLAAAHDEKAVEQLKQISLAVTRGANLTYQLLAVSGKQLLQFKPVDLNALVRNLNLILRRISGDQIQFQNTCGAIQLPILADPRVVESIIIHLVNNARFAMPNGGILTLNTAIVRAANPTEPQSVIKEYVRFTVRDTGCGMASQVQEHLFEPFFTTREAGKGMGLGLASVYGAMKQHWGWIECVSHEQRGSEFHLFFPCAPELASGLGSELQTAASLSRGTVLFIESDDRLRGAARHVLNRHGYRVIEADCNSIALMLWEGQAQHINLLVIGATLADGTSGIELATQLRQRKPDLKVLFTLADGSELVVQNDCSRMLAKPYAPAQLLQALEDFSAPVV